MMLTRFIALLSPLVATLCFLLLLPLLLRFSFFFSLILLIHAAHTRDPFDTRTDRSPHNWAFVVFGTIPWTTGQKDVLGLGDFQEDMDARRRKREPVRWHFHFGPQALTRHHLRDRKQKGVHSHAAVVCLNSSTLPHHTPHSFFLAMKMLTFFICHDHDHGLGGYTGNIV